MSTSKEPALRFHWFSRLAETSNRVTLARNIFFHATLEVGVPQVSFALDGNLCCMTLSTVKNIWENLIESGHLYRRHHKPILALRSYTWQIRTAFFSPHLCVGFLFLILYHPAPPPPSSPPPPPVCSLTHTTLSHTIFHTQLCHTPFFTHHFVTHTIFHTPLCHPPSLNTQLCHTLFHTQLCHTPSFTHHFVTHHLSHTTLSHTIFHPLLCHTPSFTHHLSHTTLAWQAWHLVTSTFVSRGKRGTWSHPPSFCVAGVALMALGWLWWRAWARFSRRWRVWRRGTLRGRRGTWWHPPSFRVAGVALGHIHLRFAWQARHLVTSTFVLRGRRGTYGTGLALVARLGPF